nr:MAG TPA: hypothetical protein [Caudoviricetes sp.]
MYPLYTDAYNNTYKNICQSILTNIFIFAGR